MASSWPKNLRTGLETFLKAEIGVFEILGQQCLNTVVFFAILAYRRAT